MAKVHEPMKNEEGQLYKRVDFSVNEYSQLILSLEQRVTDLAIKIVEEEGNSQRLERYNREIQNLKELLNDLES